MRIVQIANLVTPTSGGIRTVLDRLGRGYLAAGHDVHRIVPGPAPAVAVERSGVVHTLPGVPLPFSGGYRLLVDPLPVARLLTDLAPDRLEVSDRFTLTWVGSWGRSHDVPSTVVVHERLVETLRTWLPGGMGSGFLAALADRRLPLQFDRLVVPSTYAARSFDHADNVAVVPLGVDLATFRPGRAGDLPAGLCPDPARVRLAMVGRLSREKRPLLGMGALARQHAAGVPVELHVVGDGPLRRRLERAATDLPVTFHGFVDDRRRVAALLGSADVALATCPIETYGLAALEALACGVPVVAARGGALDELVTPDVGVVVEAEVEAMAAGVRRILERDRGQLRVAARTRAESFPWRRTVDDMLRLHRVEGSEAPRPTAPVTATSLSDATGPG